MKSSTKSTHRADYLIVEDMEIPCQVGDTPEEQAFPQIVTLTLKIYLPLNKAGQSDALKDSFDYTKAINLAKKTFSSKKFVLIESASESLAKNILQSKIVESVSITATKKIFPGIRAVGCHIFREQS